MKRHHRRTRTIVLALALAASAAPSAFAQQDLRSPDTRDATIAATTVRQDLRSPDSRDAAVPHWTGGRMVVVRIPAAAEPAPVASSSGGMDWGDAGIGGLIALVALACAGTVVLVRRDAFRTMFADGTRGWRRGVGL